MNPAKHLLAWCLLACALSHVIVVSVGKEGLADEPNSGRDGIADGQHDSADGWPFSNRTANRVCAVVTLLLGAALALYRFCKASHSTDGPKTEEALPAEVWLIIAAVCAVAASAYVYGRVPGF